MNYREHMESQHGWGFPTTFPDSDIELLHANEHKGDQPEAYSMEAHTDEHAELGFPLHMEDTMTVDRYRINDVLGALSAEFSVTLDDDTLNELTHHVADVIEKGRTPA